jgi:hypothetical protein
MYCPRKDTTIRKAVRRLARAAWTILQANLARKARARGCRFKLDLLRVLRSNAKLLKQCLCNMLLRPNPILLVGELLVPKADVTLPLSTVQLRM